MEICDFRSEEMGEFAIQQKYLCEPAKGVGKMGKIKENRSESPNLT
jgi:hypothetical protein